MRQAPARQSQRASRCRYCCCQSGCKNLLPILQKEDFYNNKKEVLYFLAIAREGKIWENRARVKFVNCTL